MVNCQMIPWWFRSRSNLPKNYHPIFDNSTCTSSRIHIDLWHPGYVWCSRYILPPGLSEASLRLGRTMRRGSHHYCAVELVLVQSCISSWKTTIGWRQESQVLLNSKGTELVLKHTTDYPPLIPSPSFHSEVFLVFRKSPVWYIPM